MKRRTGLVSNSSTTSFLIYGICTDGDEFELKDDEDVTETLERIFNDEFEVYQPYDSVYVGKSWDHIQDDETGLEFKEKIQAMFEQKLGRKVECSTYEEAYSN